jgi:hypothetical protein
MYTVNVSVTAISEMYELPVSVYFVYMGQITPALTFVVNEFVTEGNISVLLR